MASSDVIFFVGFFILIIVAVLFANLKSLNRFKRNLYMSIILIIFALIFGIAVVLTPGSNEGLLIVLPIIIFLFGLILLGTSFAKKNK